MKKIFAACFLAMAFIMNAQTTANRFFYELTYKPGKESDSIHKTMTILDVVKDKSIYQDYLMVSQDSLLKAEVEQMMKSGAFKDLSKTIKQPKFAYKVTKTYPNMEVTYTENILQDKVSYQEQLKLDWKVNPEKAQIGEYKAQKATTSFGGREWTAWFSTDIPFQDGPYKFHGLPGLIVKVEDSEKDYSWELKGNKKVDNYEEESYSEKMMKQFYGSKGNALNVSRERFEQLYENYKKDPFGSIRSQIAQIPAEAKMPDGTSMAQLLKDQEAKLKQYLNENNNPIERTSPKGKGKK